MHVPQNLDWHQTSGVLVLIWDTGLASELTSQQLRQACRCGGCENMRRTGVVISVSDDIRLTQICPVGEMGVQLHFSDEHDRGIYPWPYLYKLATQSELQECAA